LLFVLLCGILVLNHFTFAADWGNRPVSGFSHACRYSNSPLSGAKHCGNTLP
jgi:hypothetical protein